MTSQAITDLISAAKSLMNEQPESINTLDSLLNACEMAELATEIELLEAYLKEPETFETKFKKRCEERSVLTKDALSAVNHFPASKANRLYWDIALEIANPKNMKSVVGLLMPEITSVIEIEINDEQPPVARIAERPLNSANGAFYTNPNPEFEQLSNFVSHENVLFNFELLTPHDTENQSKFHKELNQNFPALAAKIYNGSDQTTKLNQAIQTFTPTALPEKLVAALAGNIANFQDSSNIEKIINMWPQNLYSLLIKKLPDYAIRRYSKKLPAEKKPAFFQAMISEAQTGNELRALLAGLQYHQEEDQKTILRAFLKLSLPDDEKLDLLLNYAKIISPIVTNNDVQLLDLLLKESSPELKALLITSKKDKKSLLEQAMDQQSEVLCDRLMQDLSEDQIIVALRQIEASGAFKWFLLRYKSRLIVALQNATNPPPQLFVVAAHFDSDYLELFKSIIPTKKEGFFSGLFERLSWFKKDIALFFMTKMLSSFDESEQEDFYNQWYKKSTSSSIISYIFSIDDSNIRNTYFRAAYKSLERASQRRSFINSSFFLNENSHDSIFVLSHAINTNDLKLLNLVLKDNEDIANELIFKAPVNLIKDVLIAKNVNLCHLLLEKVDDLTFLNALADLAPEQLEYAMTNDELKESFKLRITNAIQQADLTKAPRTFLAQLFKSNTSWLDLTLKTIGKNEILFTEVFLNNSSLANSLLKEKTTRAILFKAIKSFLMDPTNDVGEEIIGYINEKDGSYKTGNASFLESVLALTEDQEDFLRLYSDESLLAFMMQNAKIIATLKNNTPMLFELTQRLVNNKKIDNPIAAILKQKDYHSIIKNNPELAKKMVSLAPEKDHLSYYNLLYFSSIDFPRISTTSFKQTVDKIPHHVQVPLFVHYVWEMGQIRPELINTYLSCLEQNQLEDLFKCAFSLKSNNGEITNVRITHFLADDYQQMAEFLKNASKGKVVEFLTEKNSAGENAILTAANNITSFRTVLSVLSQEDKASLVKESEEDSNSLLFRCAEKETLSEFIKLYGVDNLPQLYNQKNHEGIRFIDYLVNYPKGYVDILNALPEDKIDSFLNTQLSDKSSVLSKIYNNFSKNTPITNPFYSYYFQLLNDLSEAVKNRTQLVKVPFSYPQTGKPSPYINNQLEVQNSLYSLLTSSLNPKEDLLRYFVENPDSYFAQNILHRLHVPGISKSTPQPECISILTQQWGLEDFYNNQALAEKLPVEALSFDLPVEHPTDLFELLADEGSKVQIKIRTNGRFSAETPIVDGFKRIEFFSDDVAAATTLKEKLESNLFNTFHLDVKQLDKESRKSFKEYIGKRFRIDIKIAVDEKTNQVQLLTAAGGPIYSQKIHDEFIKHLKVLDIEFQEAIDYKPAPKAVEIPKNYIQRSIQFKPGEGKETVSKFFVEPAFKQFLNNTIKPVGIDVIVDETSGHETVKFYGDNAEVLYSALRDFTAGCGHFTISHQKNKILSDDTINSAIKKCNKFLASQPPYSGLSVARQGDYIVILHENKPLNSVVNSRLREDINVQFLKFKCTLTPVYDFQRIFNSNDEPFAFIPLQDDIEPTTIAGYDFAPEGYAIPAANGSTNTSAPVAQESGANRPWSNFTHTSGSSSTLFKQPKLTYTEQLKQAHEEGDKKKWDKVKKEIINEIVRLNPASVKQIPDPLKNALKLHWNKWDSFTGFLPRFFSAVRHLNDDTASWNKVIEIISENKNNTPKAK